MVGTCLILPTIWTAETNFFWLRRQYRVFLQFNEALLELKVSNTYYYLLDLLDGPREAHWVFASTKACSLHIKNSQQKELKGEGVSDRQWLWTQKKYFLHFPR